MERLVGLALSRYLAVYIKDFSSSQFKNWTLHDLEFKEEVVQSLAGIPANFELKKVTCNQIYAKIPSLSMLGSEPIVLVADTLCIELEEPEVIKSAPAPTQAPAASATAVQAKSSQGLMDRIIDNIKFELKELRVKLRLRGKDGKSPIFSLVVQDIQIKSTNSKWQVVDLREVHTVDKNGHVIMHKEVDIGRFSFSVALAGSDSKPIDVLSQLPIRVRTKTKKAYFRGPTINHGIFLDVLDELALRLHQKQFKILQDAVDALLECMGRSAPPSPNTSSIGSSTMPIQVAATAPAQQTTEPSKPTSSAPSLWGRFASVIGSYAGYGSSAPEDSVPVTSSAQATTATPTPASPAPPPEGNADFDVRSPASSIVLEEEEDSDEEYRDAESEVEPIDLADKTSKSVQNEEDDITHTSYTIGLQSGRISIYDHILEEHGIAELIFSKLRCQFVPSIKAVRPKFCFDQTISSSTITYTQETELVEQTTISISIESYGLNQIDFGPDRHPEFTYLLKRLPSASPTLSTTSSAADITSTDRPTLNLDFVKFPDWNNPKHIRKEASLTIDRVAIVADLRPWERLYTFFFGGQKGEKFAQYMQENLGQMLEAALNEQVHFKFDLRQPTFLLPPYASKFAGKPHLASKVLRLHAHNLSFKSTPVESACDMEFSRGLFTATEFPANRSIDFSYTDMDPHSLDSLNLTGSSIDKAESASSSNSANGVSESITKYKYPKQYDPRDPLVMTERKFEVTMSDMWIDIQADPSSPPERVLQPFNMNAQMIRREFQLRSKSEDPIHLPKWTPQLEGFVSLSEIGVAFTPSQYTFLLGIWSERLAWNPSQVTEEMREALKMEKLLEAATAGASSSNTASINLPPADDPPLLMRVRVFVPKANIKLLESSDDLGSSGQVSRNPTASTNLSSSTLNGSKLASSLSLEEVDENDSPSSTIQHNENGSDADTVVIGGSQVVLAEMEFADLSYILESHADRSITKVTSPTFTVTSPMHADSPFSKLVAPYIAEKLGLNGSQGSINTSDQPALMVRMEKLKDDRPATLPESDPKPSILLGDDSEFDVDIDPNDIYLKPYGVSPVMNVRLNGMQICWIYTTLAQVQVFFTKGDEVPVELRTAVTLPYSATYVAPPQASSIPANVTTGSNSKSEESQTEAAAPPSLGMDWVVFLTQSELVVVETPDTPECMPMSLLDARFDRRGVSVDETQFDFYGKCAFYSEMLQSDQGTFTRATLTPPFNMEVAYVQSRNPVTNGSSTNFEILIDDLQVTFNRKQLIMIQNILDNQMADIRDVSTKREAEKEKEAAQLAKSTSGLSSASVPSSSIPVSSSEGLAPHRLALSSSSSSINQDKPLMKLALPTRSSTPPKVPVRSPSGPQLSTRNSLSQARPRLDRSMDDIEDGEFNPRASSGSIPRPSSKPGSLSINTDAYRAGEASLAQGGFLPESLVKVLRNRFQIGVQKLNLKLLDASDKPFAAIHLDDFLYSTENWSDVSAMLIEGGKLTVNSLLEKDSGKDGKISPYATLLQPRLETSIGGNMDAISVAHAPTLVPVVESFMPVISEATGPGLPSALQAKLARELRQASKPPHAPPPPRSNHQEMDQLADLSDAIPINHDGGYGSIAASPMLNSFVMLSPPGSAPNSGKLFQDGDAPSSAPNSIHDINKQSSSSNNAGGSLQLRGRRRVRRRGGRTELVESAEAEIVPLLSTSASAGNIHDLMDLSNATAPSGISHFLTPARAPKSTKRRDSPFPASGRDPSGFSSSLRTPHPIQTNESNLEQLSVASTTQKVRRTLHSSNGAQSSEEDRTTISSPTKLRTSTSTKRSTINRSTMDGQDRYSGNSKRRSQLWTTDTSDDLSDDESSAPSNKDEPVQLTDGRMFSLKFENIQPDFKGEREEKHARWMSRWVIGFAPFDIVYDPTALAALQDFFALMAEHKNLRHRYQNFQAEVLKVYKEQGGILNETGLEQIQVASSQQQPNSSSAPAAVDDSSNRVALNIMISGPRVSMPQPLEEESKSQDRVLLSVLEFSLESIRVLNSANASARNDNLSQTKILLTGARCFMKTVQLGESEELAEDMDVPASVVQQQPSSSIPSSSRPSMELQEETSEEKTLLTAISLQTQELVRPLTAKIVIEIKPVSASGRPFMHVSCDVDMLAAMISIKRYQLLVGLINNYVLSFFQRTRSSNDDLGLSPEYSAFLDVQGDTKQTRQSMDKIIEVNIKTVNMTVISDYMAELELVYLHLTDFNTSVGIYNRVTDVTISGRMELLINNLNYMIPERFVDELNFVVHLRSEQSHVSSSKKSGLNESRGSDSVTSTHRRGYSYEAVEEINRVRDTMVRHNQRKLNRSILSDTETDTEAPTDLSIIVEADDTSVMEDSLVDLDEDESMEEVPEQGQGELATTTVLDIAVLDQLKFTLTQDLMRHLVELYQLYAMVQKDIEGTGNKTLLHFQYLLVNRTESPIRYWQTNTDDVRLLKPGEETYFTFSNPYQLKRLEVQVEGWTCDEQAFSPEEVGSMKLLLHQTVDNVVNTRDLIVAIQPKGLKRYVEFLATHNVVNDTDKVLLLRVIHRQAVSESTTEYVIAPHMTVPVACAESSQVTFSVSFGDGSWEFSKPLPIAKDRPDSVTDTLKLYAKNMRDERWLLCTSTREEFPGLFGVTMVTLHFAAPVVIDNLCVFPLEYYFPSMLPRRPRASPSQGPGYHQGITNDEDRLADSIAAVLPANSTAYFYFDTFRHRELCCRLAGYSVWSGRIQIERVQQSSLELYKTADECMEGEKDDILISVFIYGRHHDFARRLAFNTQFLFVNDTDMLLFVRQQNTLPMTQIAPRQMTPFSWVRGSSKMLSVNMGNTAWSPPVDIATDSFQRIEIKVPNFDVSYMFLMESHTLDNYSRVVAWRSWFHIRNHTSYDLKFYLKGASKKAAVSDDLPTFELDDSDDEEAANPPRNSKKKAPKNADYAMLTDGSSDEEETFGSVPPPGSIELDFESPTVRNTVFGNVSVSDEGWILIPSHSNTTSGLCPDTLGLTIARDSPNNMSNLASETNSASMDVTEMDPTQPLGHPANPSSAQSQPELWSAVEIPTSSQSTYSVPITSLSDPRIFRAIDVSVTTDEKGLYVTLTENKDPPFIINNDTPFALKLRRQPKTASLSEMDSSSPNRRVNEAFTPSGKRSTSITVTSPSQLQAEEYIIEPNSSLKLYGGTRGAEDEFEYRASMLAPEERASATPTPVALAGGLGGRHGRKTSGGNPGAMGLVPQGHRRMGSGSAFSPTSDFPEQLISPTANRRRHTLVAPHGTPPLPSTNDSNSLGTPNVLLLPGALTPTLPPITDDDEEDLQSAMDGLSSDEEADGVTFEPDNARPPSSKRSRRKRALPQASPVASSSQSASPSIMPRLALPDGSVLHATPEAGPVQQHRRGHSRGLSGSGQLLSPRATIAMDAMDAFSSAMGTYDPRGSSNDSQVFVHGSSVYASSSKDTRLGRQFRQYFAPSMEVWSAPFSLRSALEFSVEWKDSERDPFNTWHNPPPSSSDGEFDGASPRVRAPNMLVATGQPQGKTRVVKLSLPPIDASQDQAEDEKSKTSIVRRVMKVDFLLPEVQVLMLTSDHEAAALVRLQKTQLEVNQYSNMQHSIFFVIQHAEANTLSATAEYPVLFGLDKRALHGAHPRFLEFLVEWNVREQRTFIDYIGLRILPFVLQMDSEVIDAFGDIQELLAPLSESPTQGSGDATTDNSTASSSTKAPSSSANDRRKILVEPPGGIASSMASSSHLMVPATMELSSDSLSDYMAVGRLGLGDSGNFGGGFFYSGAADRELTDNNPGAPRNRRKTAQALSKHTNIQLYQFVPQKEIVQDNYLYVGRLEIFPLRVTLSIGTNSKHWPVIAEAQMNLPAFSRTDLSESIGTLFSTLGSAYSNLVWAEVFQIIGNLDAIASPLQNLRKLTTGVTDFFKLPLEGLVLDDTPGAYLVGLWYGTASLVLNFTDFLLTVLMKSFQTLSWVIQVVSLDEDFQTTKALVARQHPTNVVYGMGQGVRECARGLFEGVSGFVTLPMKGVKKSGAPGFFSGAGKALIGFPLKPIGGIFDLFSKTFEGLLQTMGRGYLLQERADALAVVRQQLPEGEVRENIQKFIAQRDQRVLIIDDARFMRHGRPLERYLVLTFHALYIINTNKLHFDDYSPKKIPIAFIKDLVVPVTPETQMVVRLNNGQQLWKQDQFLFIVPDRKHFIIKMAARFGIKTLEVAKLEKLH